MIARDPLFKIKLKLKKAYKLRLYKIRERIKKEEAIRIAAEKKKTLEVIDEESSE